MKTLLLILLVLPLELWAQADSLKPIGNELIPGGYYGGRYGYGQSVRTQYTYDELDIKPKALGQYILASGDDNAIREYNTYMNGRHAGGWLIGGGILTAGIGLGVAIGNDHSGEKSDGPYSSQPTVVNGNLCYGNCNAIPDRTNRAAVKAGVTTLFSGLLISAIGFWMQRPGQHMRRSVQYYNKSLKQRGVSWQLTPYSSISNSGVGLVGQF